MAALLLAALVWSTASPQARADATPTTRFTLDEAIAFALAHHPALRAASARESAAAARVQEAELGELPNVGISAQLNRSTGNAVPGSFFPTMGFPTVAGPTRGRALDAGTWQTGVSLWATWDLMSLAKDPAVVDASRAGKVEADAATAERRLEVEFAVAEAFMGVVAAKETVRAARANVGRAEVLARTVKSLTDQSLRPGADAARAQAEVAVAQTQLIRAEQGEDVRRAELATALGVAGTPVDVAPGALLGPVDSLGLPTAPPSAEHPLVKQSDAVVTRAEQQKRAVDLEVLPRVDLIGALWLRGSGLYSGLDIGAAKGLVPETPNWAAGVAATWPVLDVPTVRARSRVAAANESVAVAGRDESKLAVDGQRSVAQRLFAGALRVARNTAPALAAARAAEGQATSRYQSGLAPVIEVADAQRLLAQAELEDAIARLEVRHALLLFAKACGDLAPFLASARGAAPSGG